MLSMLDLDHKCQGHSRNQKTMTGKKNLSRESLSNWCDADSNADMDTHTDSGKIISRSPPYREGETYLISNFHDKCFVYLRVFSICFEGSITEII